MSFQALLVQELSNLICLSRDNVLSRPQISKLPCLPSHLNSEQKCTLSSIHNLISFNECVLSIHLTYNIIHFKQIPTTKLFSYYIMYMKYIEVRLMYCVLHVY